MKKIFHIQTFFLILFSLTVISSTYTRIKYFNDIAPINVKDFILFFGIISSIAIVIYGIYLLTKFNGIKDALELIYKSIFINSNYQLGFYNLFIIVNVIIGITCLIVWINNVSKEARKKS